MTGYPETATGLPAPGPGVADAAGPGPIRPLHTILELAALPSAVPCARRHARGVVGEWGLPTAAGTTELLVSEMITNAVAETAGTQDPLGGVITLRLTAAIGTVLIEVHDPSPRLPERKEAPDDAEHGRGLLLVDELSADWGAYPLPGNGKIVWCLVTAVPRERQPPSAPGAADP